MANTSAVYARIDQNLKMNAEGILSELGISPSSAIQMFYTQVVRQRGMPFPLTLRPQPLSLSSMTEEEINRELEKGMDALQQGECYSAKEVNRKLAEDLGL